ncbi:3-carboxy-cis,cis-muconate cycloisomerase [Verruconis gallopava]|uniref:3-carboxy-cis,cis-muconate cycloisomerase n=1 Tax=Verruconis gallopava TaxID=253628 RepID=A0A0D2AQX8_9PEZI|nr:3-carboxy-cis,cis-muconate cycloisomerase [Verruconis gallopava]KIW09088.1 3-carboxy-cis,cis-muconate cycloisomerase [Verruconis gallopava]
MTAVSDSIIFRNIFATPESTAIWSDERRTAYYLLFEKCLAEAQADLGIIPQKACDEIVKRCKTEYLDWEELRRQTEIIGYPVLPVVKQLVKGVNDVEPGLGEYSHWGATTQDVTDTATVLQIRDTLQILQDAINDIVKSTRMLAGRHKETPMAARSNLQQAVPITYGFKLARLLATFYRHQQRLNELRERILVLEFSGAAGTLATLDKDNAMKCQKLLAEKLGLKVPAIAWHTERDNIAEFGAFLAMLTSTCAKFALDTKIQMSTEVGEVSEPYVPHRGSSSTMPQKRNPISCAYITSMNATVRQLSASLFEAMVEDFERSTGPWEIEWVVLPQICTLSHATLMQTRNLIDGLEVHTDAMRKNLQLTHGAIVSEAVMMELGKTIGRQYAHDLVYDLCRRAQREDKALVDLLDEHPEVNLTRDRLQQLCDPNNYLGLSVEMTEQVLEQLK